jgi:hypothetical protein
VRGAAPPLLLGLHRRQLLLDLCQALLVSPDRGIELVPADERPQCWTREILDAKASLLRAGHQLAAIGHNRRQPCSDRSQPLLTVPHLPIEALPSGFELRQRRRVSELLPVGGHLDRQFG